MSSPDPIQVVITDSALKTTSGQVVFCEWDQQVRTMRGLKVLGLLWSLAVASVFIPVAHFVLVPGFFVIGPLVAWIRYRQEREIVSGQGPCPKCGHEIFITPGMESWPQAEKCGACLEIVHVELVNNP